MTWTMRLRHVIATTLMVGWVAVALASATHVHVEAGATGVDQCVSCRVAHSTSLAPAATLPLRLAVLALTVEAPQDVVASLRRERREPSRGPPSLFL